LGVAGLDEIPKVLAAVDEGNETAAAESHRNGILDQRNQRSRVCFWRLRENNG
jgi:hypothetical protein